MKIPEIVLSKLSELIKIEEELLVEIETGIVKDHENRICLVISVKGELAKNRYFDAIGQKELIKLIEQKSNLFWEIEDETIFLRDGYVVVRDEICFDLIKHVATVQLEQYYRISNTPEHPTQMYSEMLYIDNELRQNETWDPDFEFCDISFAGNLP